MSLTHLNVQLKKMEVDTAIVTLPSDIFYLTQFKTEPHERVVALVIQLERDPLLLLPAMEVEQARADGWAGDVLPYKDTDQPWELLAASLDSATISTLGIQKNHLTVERLEAIQQTLEPTKVIAVENVLQQMRLVKSPQELAIMKEAALFADKGVEIGKHALKEGITELEVKNAIEQGLAQLGIAEMAFKTTVLFGKRSAQPHGNSGNTALCKGDIALFDLGVVHNGYTSDITRCFLFAEYNEEAATIYEAVLAAEEQAIKSIAPGVPIATAERAARDELKTRKLETDFTHRLGHGLGIDVHEFPSLHEKNETPFCVGMTFTVEPGVYVPSIGGIRIEDDIVVTEHGYEILTESPKQLEVVPYK
ncbi:M24 family metallopeptidase [Aureibacillus halotolerans]|uniref:Xaa-Pro aminopeptidase n=1 Tax=Aureibacillus halotolerans TaxID=1508390 RepID=A0A4R6U3P4_9BACI|nr:Xaa-Pro peptidase family protein [Aureibacillus halotolerans]TDQ39119.1 Xaa-Pro aminopeptidase [Aureibacillus halotolerans]